MREQFEKLFGTIISLSPTLTVSTESFFTYFADCTELSYNELKRVDNEKNYGYDKYIDEWKDDGLIE